VKNAAQNPVAHPSRALAVERFTCRKQYGGVKAIALARKKFLASSIKLINSII
jgi:hypothetical protein